MTYFMYVDEIQEVLKQLVKDPALQSLYFAMWSQEHGIFESDNNIAQNLDSFSLQDEGKEQDYHLRPRPKVELHMRRAKLSELSS